MSKKAGRPRGSPKNHHLKLEGDVWTFRWARNGRDVRRSTGMPKSELARAREIRDKWIGEFESKRHGVEEPTACKTLAEIERLYLAAESNPYDREKGGEQEGTKRDAEGDRHILKRLHEAGLDPGISADLIDAEKLLDTSKELARKGYAPLTRRNSFRLLRRVYKWARVNKRKTGVLSNPFEELDTEKAKLFSNKVQGEAPPFTREQFRALLDLLPAHAYRPVRFAAHTGMRCPSDLLHMVWGRVNFERRVYVVDPRFAKRGKEREVPLGDVALSILDQVRPANARPEDPVWLGRNGRPVKDLRTVYEDRVEDVCPAPGPGKRYPDLHSLRRTCATALSLVARKAVVRAVLGHEDEDVTDRYIDVPLSEQLAAVNAAALHIDGEPTQNVVPIRSMLAAAG